MKSRSSMQTPFGSRNALVYKCISGREFKCAYDLIEARELEQRQPVTDGAHQPIVRQSERHSQKRWQWKLEYGEQMAISEHRNVLSTLIALTSVVQSEQSGRLLFALLFLGECATNTVRNIILNLLFKLLAKHLQANWRDDMIKQ